MHNFPCSLFGSKDTCGPQTKRSDILTLIDPGLVEFHLYDVGKLSSYALRYGLDIDFAMAA
jgi:hypothetical protein